MVAKGIAAQNTWYFKDEVNELSRKYYRFT